MNLVLPTFALIFLVLFSKLSFSETVDVEGVSPPMGPTLSFPDKVNSINEPEFGKIKISGVASAFGMSQSNPADGNAQSLADISNAQLVLNKNSGMLQFYLQAGYYSTPSLGTSYQRANRQTIDSFGLLPLAYLTVPIGNKWKISAGKLNSFGGYENTFTFQNINIDRGLLWNQTSNVSRGFELEYSAGSLTAAVTLNDGFYSNQLSWMGASIGYKLSMESTANISWTGAIKASTTNTSTTPLAQNNSQIFNAIYSYTSDRWLITPYLQYTFVPENPAIGILSSNQTMGAALLMNYRFANLSSDKFSLPLRFEYIDSSGKTNPSSPNLLYGIGSSAWSATVTPTYQFINIFVRAEVSYVKAVNSSQGQAFGSAGTRVSQSRLVLETGILF